MLEKEFLEYVPHTDQLIIYYGCKIERVKMATHCKFDEGFNFVLIESVPIGFQQIF